MVSVLFQHKKIKDNKSVEIIFFMSVCMFLNSTQEVRNLCHETLLAWNKNHTRLAAVHLVQLLFYSEATFWETGPKYPDLKFELFLFCSLMPEGGGGGRGGVSHKVLHIKRGTVLSSATLVLVSCIKHREFFFTFTYEGWKILATYPGSYKRGLFSPSEGAVSNITRQLARKREMEEPITSAS